MTDYRNNLRIGDRVRAIDKSTSGPRSVDGLTGEIAGWLSTADGNAWANVQFDCMRGVIGVRVDRLERIASNVHPKAVMNFTEMLDANLPPGDERGFTARFESLERNVSDHETSIGRLDKGFSAHLFTEAKSEADFADRAHAIELRAELNARRIEEVAEKTSERLDVHRQATNTVVRRIDDLEQRLDRDIARRKAIANGPRSYDRRIAALQHRIIAMENAYASHLLGFDTRDVLNRLAALEARKTPAVFEDGCACADLDGCDGSCEAAERAMIAQIYGLESDHRATDDATSTEDAVLAAVRAVSEEKVSEAISESGGAHGAANRVESRAEPRYKVGDVIVSKMGVRGVVRGYSGDPHYDIEYETMPNDLRTVPAGVIAGLAIEIEEVA